jgi:hypothetical protein
VTTLQSAFAKLKHAKDHRDALRADVEAFRATDPPDWTMRQTSYREDQNRLTTTIVVQVNKEKPDNWPVVIGDILTNLRAALDHSIYGHAASRTTLAPQQERSMAS